FPKPPNEPFNSLTVLFNGAKNCIQLEIACPKALNTSLVTFRIFMKFVLQASQKPATATPIAAIAIPIGFDMNASPKALNAVLTPLNAIVKAVLNGVLELLIVLRFPIIPAAFEATAEPNFSNEEIGWRIALANLPRMLDDSDILLSNCRNVSIGWRIAALRLPSLEPNSVALELVLVVSSATFSAPSFISSSPLPAPFAFSPAPLKFSPAVLDLLPLSLIFSPACCDFCPDLSIDSDILSVSRLACCSDLPSSSVVR